LRRHDPGEADDEGDQRSTAQDPDGAMELVDATIDPVEARLHSILEPIETPIDFSKTSIDVIEAPIDLVEAPPHLPGEIVQAVVGPALPHRLNDCTLNVAGAHVANETETFQQQMARSGAA
jgi:hypothetical protein